MSDRSKFRMVSAVREASRQMPFPLPGAFFLTDPARTPDPVAIIPTLPPGTGVIYRHYGAADRFDIGMKLRQACYFKGVPLLIANDPALAITLNADGVHWPEANAGQARKWRGRFQFQSQSVHSVAGINKSVCDIVFFSTVFPSNSPSAKQAIGALKFRKLARQSGKFLYALGGVNSDTAAAVSGVAGLAGIEGFL